MARTGIKITTANTVLGNPIDVNSTSMIISIVRAEGGELEDTPLRKGRSLAEFGVAPDSQLGKAISAYFNPAENISLEGNLLWATEIVLGQDSEETFEFAPTDSSKASIVELLQQTVSKSFDERPRQVALISRIETDADTRIDLSGYNEGVAMLNELGIRCVYIAPTELSLPDSSLDNLHEAADLAELNKPFLAYTLSVETPASTTTVSSFVSFGPARVAAMLAYVSVGTSIGDGGLPALTEPAYLYYMDAETRDAFYPVKMSGLTPTQLNILGDKQYLFTRTRPPRNGLWWNDGATCADADTALSTLEAARTICALADDLQAFFVPYINSRVPVTSTGDIQSAYKQVVLDNARAAVIQRYVENGDISDARINLVAKDNDMIGTRTWEVTLSILPAPTLRWVDGYVFYVKSL